MCKSRLNLKRISVGILLVIQICVISLFFNMQPSYKESSKGSVSFLVATPNNKTDPQPTYHTAHSRIILKSVTTRKLYEDFNSSLCYKKGTDIKLMRRSHNSWKCECLPGYHGIDCGQAEVIWRTLLALRKPIHLKGPRSFERRIIYVFEINEITRTISDIRLNELNQTVDLFILYELNSNFMQNQLTYSFLKEFHSKILYLRINRIEKLWYQIKSVITNLKNDDLILTSGFNEIPNVAALQFFKLYDNWPEPISFRLRWSVFGFFWIHPNKTFLKIQAFTKKYLYEVLNNQLSIIINNNNKTKSNFNIGDLNHYGGWYCELCNDPIKIIDELNRQPKQMIFEVGDKKTIDVNYVEELIENGLYIDGKTELLRAHRFRESYFAPTFLTENSWKYDYLMLNIYSKMDYYE